jgi:hypothetical protein
VLYNDHAPVPTAGTRTGVSASGRNAGLYQPYSNQLGYDIVGGGLSIAARLLDITATGTDKVYDGTLQASAALSDNRIAGDAITATYTSASFADRNVGAARSMTVSGITLSGSDAVNYTYNNSAVTSASIRPKPLLIVANPDSKLFDGRPYSGGNGVMYSGFVPGETETVLGGQLRYGGDAQGAVGVGNYRITGGGLDSANYSGTFVDGALTILAPRTGDTPLSPLTPALADLKPVIATVFADTDARSTRRQPAPRGQPLVRVRVLDCGITLPEDMMLDACSP